MSGADGGAAREVDLFAISGLTVSVLDYPEMEFLVDDAPLQHRHGDRQIDGFSDIPS